MGSSSKTYKIDRPDFLTMNEGSQLSGLLSAIPELIWVRDPGTHAIQYCSPAIEPMWGLRVEQVRKEPRAWLASVDPEDRVILEEALRQVEKDGKLDIHYRVVRPDGMVRWVHDRGRMCDENQGDYTGLVGIARDVTETKRTEVALRAAYDALHSSVSGVIITDTRGGITYANPSFLRLFGYASETEALGAHPLALVVWENPERRPDVDEDPFSTGETPREFRMKRRDGTVLIVEVLSAAIRDAQSKHVGSMASFVDITDRKKLEQETELHRKTLQVLTERMAELEEQERRRIAGQLHDTAVQSFSLANIKLGALDSALKETGNRRGMEQLAAARDLITHGIAECRLIMADLIPPLLYEVGLHAALEEFSSRMRKLHGTEIVLEGEDDRTEVPESLRGPIFQGARELVLNACKYAGASRIVIAWSQPEDEFELVVSDDGQGFNTNLPASLKQGISGGFGLISIRERVRSLGGRMEIDSGRNHGTRIRIVLPLKTLAHQHREFPD